jgi:ATP-dependent Lon protease
MVKNSSEYLTTKYGFITDYLAEAFHYQFAHTNRYEEVNQRVRLGHAVEGRDERGIKKTISAFLKILHPDGPAGDAELEEYVAYAIECRRRIKEQMNKRKPDDEFARIDLSYFTADGKEVIVYCPESKDAQATQEPLRKALSSQTVVDQPLTSPKPKLAPVASSAPSLPPTNAEPAPLAPASAPPERHFTILYGDTGYSYESIMAPYLVGAKAVMVEDPYVRMPHQIQNFVRFCEVVVKAATIKRIRLVTSYDDNLQMMDVQNKLTELQQSLLELDIVLDVDLNPNLHDREIRLDNGWVIKIGRGLDFYQKPDGWFSIGANDLALRPCLETKVDIFRNG